MSQPAVDRLFFFNDTATTEIYTLSLHDALPIYHRAIRHPWNLSWESRQSGYEVFRTLPSCHPIDRKSTRLNSSHTVISYAVFCLKKKWIEQLVSDSFAPHPQTLPS